MSLPTLKNFASSYQPVNHTETIRVEDLLNICGGFDLQSSIFDLNFSYRLPEQPLNLRYLCEEGRGGGNMV